MKPTAPAHAHVRDAKAGPKAPVGLRSLGAEYSLVFREDNGRRYCMVTALSLAKKNGIIAVRTGLPSHGRCREARLPSSELPTPAQSMRLAAIGEAGLLGEILSTAFSL